MRDDGRYDESKRLILKFFPELTDWLGESSSISLDGFVMGCRSVGVQCDNSYVDSPNLPGTHAQLRSSEALEGSDEEIYLKILKYTGFSPSGRVVFIPDTDNFQNVYRPIICNSQTLPSRLRELDANPNAPCFFNSSHDTVVVYETGQAWLLNHDNWLFWASSIQNHMSESEKDLRHLLKRTLRAKPALCPYCRQDIQISTLTHYLLTSTSCDCKACNYQWHPH